MSDFLRLFMMSFKYVLILLRYSSTDSLFMPITVTFILLWFLRQQWFALAGL